MMWGVEDFANNIEKSVSLHKVEIIVIILDEEGSNKVEAEEQEDDFDTLLRKAMKR